MYNFIRFNGTQTNPPSVSGAPASFIEQPSFFNSPSPTSYGGQFNFSDPSMGQGSRSDIASAFPSDPAATATAVAEARSAANVDNSSPEGRAGMGFNAGDPTGRTYSPGLSGLGDALFNSGPMSTGFRMAGDTNASTESRAGGVGLGLAGIGLGLLSPLAAMAVGIPMAARAVYQWFTDPSQNPGLNPSDNWGGDFSYNPGPGWDQASWLTGPSVSSAPLDAPAAPTDNAGQDGTWGGGGQEGDGGAWGDGYA